MPQDSIRGRKLRPMARRAVSIRTAIGRSAFAAVMFAACAHSSAARAGDDDESFYSKFMQTLGLHEPGEDDGINYSERSPLVVPPNRDLPPPMAAKPPPVADWPKDPDIERRRQAKVKKVKPRQYDYVSESSRPLRPDELSVPGAPAPSNVPGNTSVAGTTGSTTIQEPPPKKGLFSFDWLKKKQQYATFTGEPVRENLTDPPSGYRTPSPDQPYGVGSETKKYKIPNVVDRQDPTR
jgi:hypothetical protein